MLGADLSASTGGLALSNELVQLRYDGDPRVRGFYSQGVYTFELVFFGARYAVTTERRSVSERTFTAAAGLEIFRGASCASSTSASSSATPKS